MEVEVRFDVPEGYSPVVPFPISVPHRCIPAVFVTFISFPALVAFAVSDMMRATVDWPGRVFPPRRFLTECAVRPVRRPRRFFVFYGWWLVMGDVGRVPGSGSDEGVYVGMHRDAAVRASHAAVGSPHGPAVGRWGVRRWAVLAAGVLLLGAAGLVVGVHVLDARYEGRALPGVSVAGASVTGTGLEGVEASVADRSSGMEVRYGSDHAHVSDYGVTVDAAGTARAAVDAKRDSPWFVRLNPFVRRDVPVRYSVDDRKLTERVYRLGGDGAPVDASAAYSPDADAFVASEGRSGRAPDVKAVRSVIAGALGSLTDADASSVGEVESDPMITTADAERRAESANRLLGSSTVTVGNGSWTVTAGRADIAAMLTFDGDSARPSEQGITAWLGSVRPKLSRDMVPQVTMVQPGTSTRIAVTQYGEDGVAVDDDGSAVKDIAAGLSAGRPVSTSVRSHVVQAEQRNVEAPSNFGVDGGDPWLKVDLTAEKAYAYRGTTLVRTFDVATGKPGTATDPGTYWVNVKYVKQTMRGEDYVTPNVPWVSYFNGGEGFHGAPWNTYNISRGVSSSHGCVNMYVTDAKWVYDFAPIGTKVEVVGSTHYGASR